MALVILLTTIAKALTPALSEGGGGVFMMLSAFEPPHYGLIYLSAVAVWRLASLPSYSWATLSLLLWALWATWEINSLFGGTVIGFSLLFIFFFVEANLIIPGLQSASFRLFGQRPVVVPPIEALLSAVSGRCQRDYAIAFVTFSAVALCLFLDSDATLERQHGLGICAWSMLIIMLLGESRSVQMQVAIAIMFATIGEHFASVYMQGYIYRFENVPLYVPPGHGMVYLTAVALARSDLFIRYQKEITNFVLISGGLWSVWGMTFASQGDAVGAGLFVIFVIYLFVGRSPLVYLAAFFITTWLELIGTYYGTWRWVPIDPVLSWSQGNPPCGVAAWYGMVDSVALAGAPILLREFGKVRVRIAAWRLKEQALLAEQDI